MRGEIEAVRVVYIHRGFIATALVQEGFRVPLSIKNSRGEKMLRGLTEFRISDVATSSFETTTPSSAAPLSGSCAFASS